MPLAFECRGCGIQRDAPWLGRCPNPNCLGLYDKKRVHVDEGGVRVAPTDGEVISFADAMLGAEEPSKLATGIAGFDHVLDGGLVLGDIVLFSGAPGAGKTSLMIMVLRAIAKRYRYPVLYVTGEMSTNRMGISAKRLLDKAPPARMLLLKEKQIDTVLDTLDEHRPKVIVIDSLQTVDVGEDLEPGNARAMKRALDIFIRYSHEETVSIFLIGHITKEGEAGGPKSLEHLADVALSFDHERKDSSQRVLSCTLKNRSGETPRWARFDMQPEGLADLGPFDPRKEAPPEPPTPPPLKLVS